MVAEFEVHEKIVLEERGLLALAGEVTEGTPRTGMRATLGEGGGRFDARVHGVEFLEDAAGTEPALTFSYGDPETLQRWREIAWSGRRVRLGWGGSGAGEAGA